MEETKNELDNILMPVPIKEKDPLDSDEEMDLPLADFIKSESEEENESEQTKKTQIDDIFAEPITTRSKNNGKKGSDQKCTECDKTFPSSRKYNAHMKNHAKPTEYICSFCNKSFTKRFRLSEHIRIHTGEKPFQCTECDKSFGRKSGLIDHQVTHIINFFL